MTRRLAHIGWAAVSITGLLTTVVTLAVRLRSPEQTAMQILISHWWFYGLALLLLVVGMGLIVIDDPT